jgi:hypothetical protein
MPLTALEEAEIIPGKHSDTRIKPLALTNDHGRYIAVTPDCVRWGMSVTYIAAKFLAVSLPKRLCNGRFTSGGFRSETVIWIQNWLKNTLGLLEGPRYNIFSRRRRWAWL